MNGVTKDVDLEKAGASSAQSSAFPTVVENEGELKMSKSRKQKKKGARNTPPLNTMSPVKISVQSKDADTVPRGPTPENEDEIQALPDQEETAGHVSTDEEDAKVNGGNRHCHSSSSAADVNRAHKEAKIRRSQQRRNRPKGQSTSVKCIEYFLAILYCIGMSPLKPPSAKKLPKWLHALQIVLYWLVATISIYQSANDVKYQWFQFRTKKDMLTFVNFGFFVADFCTRAFNIYLLATSSLSKSKLLDRIDKNHSRDKNEAETKTRGYESIVTCLIATVTLLIAAGSTIFGDIAINDWTWENAILDRSYEFSENLFVWTSANYSKVTEDLQKEYGLNLTWTTGMFGAIGNALCFMATLHGCLILDLWTIVAFQIYSLQTNLRKEMEKTKGNSRKCPLSVNWKRYLEVREICEETDELFGTQLKFIHLKNVLIFGYVLFQILASKPVSAELLIDIFTVIKVMVTYWLCVKSAEQNKMYEKCVVTCSNRGFSIKMDGKNMSVDVLLKDMEKFRIGVGSDEFFIDQKFLIQFVTAVASLFLLLSGEIKESCYGV